MDIHFRKRGKSVIAEIEGDIDHRFSEEIRRLTERELYISGADSLILDMSGVKFMDSSGIGLVMGRYRNISKTGGELHITGTSPQIYKVMKLAGIERLAKLEGNI